MSRKQEHAARADLGALPTGRGPRAGGVCRASLEMSSERNADALFTSSKCLWSFGPRGEVCPGALNRPEKCEGSRPLKRGWSYDEETAAWKAAVALAAADAG